jgi:uncharacterized delta-60 repeat protein
MAIFKNSLPIVRDGLIFNIDTLNTKSINTPIVNLSPDPRNWTIVRSTMTLVTGGTITSPIEGATIYEIRTSPLISNTLHRLSNSSVVGTTGNRFYNYSMYIMGSSGNTPTARVTLDINDRNLISLVVGTATTWNYISIKDTLPPPNSSSVYDFFDYEFYREGNLYSTGDTFYISGLVIARSLGFDNNTYVPLLQDPGYIPYNGIINTGITDMVSFNNTRFISGRQGISREFGLSIYTSGSSISTQQFSLDRETDLPQWSLSYFFKPLLRDISYLPTSTDINYASGTTTILNHSFGRFNLLGKPVIDPTDGSIFMGTTNKQYQNVSRLGVVKINSGGTINTTFNANFTAGNALDFTTQLSGSSLYVGGTNVILNRLDKNTGISTGVINNFNTTISMNLHPIDTVNNYLYVSGEFTSVSGLTRQRLTRINLNTFTPDLSLDTSNGFNGLPRVVLPHQGKILSLGNFTTYSGVARNYITRINTDGTLDETFKVGSGFDNTLLFVNNPVDMGIDSLNRIVIVGRFTTYSGIPRQHIVRLNPDGTLDNTFNIGVGFNERPYTVAIQSDNKILVGGNFTAYSGLTAIRLIRLNVDGSIDNTFNIGSGIGSFNTILYPLPIIDYILIQPDGKILLFNSTPNQVQTYSASTIPWITAIRLNPDGSIDNTFNSGFGFTKSTYRNQFSFRYLTTANTLTTFTDLDAFPGVGGRLAFSFYTNYYNNVINRVFTKDNTNTLRQYDNGLLVKTYSFNPADNLNLRMRRFNIPGNLNSLQIYNKALSQQEISQNFNVIKSRFNLT